MLPHIGPITIEKVLEVLTLRIVQAPAHYTLHDYILMLPKDDPCLPHIGPITIDSHAIVQAPVHYTLHGYILI